MEKQLLSYSRTKAVLHLWDVTSGKLKNTLKDHINLCVPAYHVESGWSNNPSKWKYDKTSSSLGCQPQGNTRKTLKGHRKCYF